MSRVADAAVYFEDNVERQDLSGQAVKSGLIALVARGVVSVVQVVTTIVLARLLSPQDYGLVAIVAALTSFVPMLIDFGLTDSTVQNRRITPSQISALFWISEGVATVVALMLFCSSSFIASSYRHPEVGSIASAWGITFVLYAAALQHMALLRRAMQYKEIAQIEIAGSIGGSAVAVAAAYLGFGYWALVSRPVVTAAITAVGSWVMCTWKPGRPSFDREIKPMLKFGINVSGGAVAWIGTNSVDRAIMGFLYPPATIGLYQNALTLYDNALQGISMPLHKVGVSALSKLRDAPELFAKKYADALSTVTFYAMPAFAVLAVVANDLVFLLLGKKWAASGPLLSIFALRGLVQIIENSQTWLHMPLGRPDRWIRWAFFTAAAQISAVLVGMSHGVEGIAVSIVVVRGLITFPAVLYAGRPIGLKLKTVLRAVGGQLIGAIAVVFIGHAVIYMLPGDTARIVRIVAATAVCAVSYLILVVGIFRVTEPLRLVSSLSTKLIPQRFHRWLPFLVPSASASVK